MKAKEFYNNQENKKDFTKLTKTGISTDYENVFDFAEAYASQLMPSDEEAIKIISGELRKCFNMGLKQSPTDAENSEFYAPYIELTIAPKLWNNLKQSQTKEVINCTTCKFLDDDEAPECDKCDEDCCCWTKPKDN